MPGILHMRKHVCMYIICISKQYTLLTRVNNVTRLLRSIFKKYLYSHGQFVNIPGF